MVILTCSVIIWHFYIGAICTLKFLFNLRLKIPTTPIFYRLAKTLFTITFTFAIESGIFSSFLKLLSIFMFSYKQFIPLLKANRKFCCHIFFREPIQYYWSQIMNTCFSICYLFKKFYDLRSLIAKSQIINNFICFL